MHTKFANDNKLEGTVDTLKSRKALKKDLDKLGLDNQQQEVLQEQVQDSATEMGQP